MAVLNVRRKEGKHSHGSYQNRFHVGHTMLENALAGQAQAQPEVQTAGVQECLDMRAMTLGKGIEGPGEVKAGYREMVDKANEGL